MTTSLTAIDPHFMALALQLAAQGQYSAKPNPCVGCVLIRDGQMIGSGWHRRAGEPHAERIALAAAAAAGENTAGSTAYVTLEPCCHHGRTPPCTDALIAAGITHVVAAMPDPNPLVAGRGFAQLRAAGIDVTVGILAAEAEQLNAGFCRRMRTQRPRVWCKLAASLDGRTALANGESRWITSAAARQDVQRLRARMGAMITGVGTVLADDPALTVRIDPETGDELKTAWPQPLRVIVDSAARTPPTAQLLRQPGQTLIATCLMETTPAIAALQLAGAEMLHCPRDPAGRVDLTFLLHALAQRECNDVLLETGATLAGAALQAGLIDDLIIYFAPHIIGDSGRGLFALPAITQMSQRRELQLIDVRHVGCDLRLHLRPVPDAT